MKFHRHLFPHPMEGNYPFRAKFNSTCKRCNGACKIGDMVIYDKVWSMSEGVFYDGVVHVNCFPDIMNDFYNVRSAVYALYSCLGLPFQEIKTDWNVQLIPMYLHQVNRPIVLGQRPDYVANGRKISSAGSVFVSLRTKKQLTVVHKNATAYVYDESQKGRVVDFHGKPLLVSSWKPLSPEEARERWFGKNSTLP